MHSKVVTMKDAIAAHVRDATPSSSGLHPPHLLRRRAGIIRQRRDLTLARLTPI
jgi:hypothetical protein